MCRNNEHGGRRCPHNDSDSRRLRRKNANVMASISAASKQLKSENEKPVQPFKEKLSIAEIKDKVEEIKARIYSPIPEGITQEEFDKENEVLITSLGLSIAAEADRIAEYDEEEVERRISELEKLTYGASSEKLKALQGEHRKALDNFNEAIDTVIDYETGKPKYNFMMNATKYLELDKEEQRGDVTEAAEKVIKINKELDEAVENHRALDKNFDLTRAAIQLDATRKISDAYKTIIQQIRPTGGDIDFAENNTENSQYAVDIIKDTVGKHYPAEWIEYSNNHESAKNFVITTDDLRPSYTDAKGSTYSFNTQTLTDEERIHLEAAYGEGRTHNFTLVHPFEPSTKLPIKYVATSDEVYDPKEHGELVNGKPSGEGWVYIQNISGAAKDALTTPDFKPNLILKNYEEKKYWVKPHDNTTSTLKIYSKDSVDFLAERSKNPSESLTDGAAYHEFAHRMEHVFPDNMLFRQEKAFLARRTGKTSENWNENLVNLPESGEFAHKDGGFVHNYVAREYFRNNYEVFSVGIESLYGGTNGGLIGTKPGTRKDEDHRGFVLGCLATL